MMRRAMIQSIIQQFTTLMITFVTGMIIARLLSPQEIGVYTISWALVTIAGPLKDLGIGSYVISKEKIDDQILSAAYGAAGLTSLIFMVVVFLLSWPAAALYNNQEIGQVLKVIAISQLSPLATPATILLTREMRFDVLRNVAVLGGICQAVVAVSLAYIGWSTLGLAWGCFTGNLVTVIGTILYKRQTIWLRPTLSGSRQLFSFGGWMTGSMIVSIANGQVPELVIGRALSLADSALFSQANKITSIVRNVFYFALMRPVLPGFAGKQQSGESIAPLYLRIIETVSGIAWPTYMVISIWAEPLVLLLYGPKWVVAGSIVPIVALSHALSHAIMPHYEVLIVKRRMSTLFFSESGLTVVTLCLVPVGALVSLQTAAFALIVQSTCSVGWYYHVLKPIVGFDTRSLLQVWRRSLILTGSVGLVVGGVRLITPDHHSIQILPGLAASGVLGGLAWLVSVRLTRHELARHIDVLLEKSQIWLFHLISKS